MKKVFHILLVMLFVFGSVVMCGATTITTSATGTQFGDNYSYLFEITDNDVLNALVYEATLTNTSPASSSSPPLDPLIDRLAFNMDATLSTDFYIAYVDPSTWSIIVPTGGGIQFDYIGDTSDQDDRLHRGEALTFDFVFYNTFGFPTDPFELWTGTDESLGTGLGGGTDSGQVAVSFQRLGGDEEHGGLDESDLLASNWEGSGEGEEDPPVIPEPATMLLLGSGLIGFAVSGKKRFKKTNK